MTLRSHDVVENKRSGLENELKTNCQRTPNEAVFWLNESATKRGRTGIRSQKSEGRSQKAEVRSRNEGPRNQKSPFAGFNRTREQERARRNAHPKSANGNPDGRATERRTFRGVRAPCGRRHKSPATWQKPPSISATEHCRWPDIQKRFYRIRRRRECRTAPWR